MGILHIISFEITDFGYSFGEWGVNVMLDISTGFVDKVVAEWDQVAEAKALTFLGVATEIWVLNSQ